MGCELEGGLEKNGFTQILFILKTFKISFMSWNTDFGSVSPFPMLKLHMKFLSLGKRLFWRVQDFFFWLPYNPHLGWKMLKGHWTTSASSPNFFQKSWDFYFIRSVYLCSDCTLNLTCSFNSVTKIYAFFFQ